MQQKSITNEWLYIPGGEFEMGVSIDEAEQVVRTFFHPDDEINPHLLYTEVPNHKVNVVPFNITKYEVTNLEFKDFVDGGGYTNKDLWKELISISDLNTDLYGWQRIELFHDRTGKSGPRLWSEGTYEEGTADHPVEAITWFEAAAYCRWKKCRLPSEAEWEYVARGVEKRAFPWGNDAAIGDAIRKRNWRKSVAVNANNEDRTPFGVFGMGGNVAEWVAEAWYPYRDSPLGKLEKNDEAYGIVRGGGYISDVYQMRSTYRERKERLDDSSPVGFRCAK